MEKFENIKVGDEVIVYGGYTEQIRKVEKITPTGLIKVGGCLYYKNGGMRGGDRWSRSHIAMATPELKKKIEEETTIRKANYILTNYKVKDYETAAKIIELLGG